MRADLQITFVWAGFLQVWWAMRRPGVGGRKAGEAGCIMYASARHSKPLFRLFATCLSPCPLPAASNRSSTDQQLI